MNKRFGFLIWCLLAMAPVACSEKDEALPLSDVPRTYAQAFCAKVFGCCNASERKDAEGGLTEAGFASQTACEEEMTAALKNKHTEAALAAQGLAYDPEQGRRCLDAFAAMSCTDYGGEDDTNNGECRGAFVGLTSPGQACTSPFECRNGRCVDDKCQALPGPGESCKASRGECQDGLVCSISSFTCIELKHEGDTCADHDECLSQYCGDTLKCGAPPEAMCDGK